jgi:hypothetical protein
MKSYVQNVTYNYCNSRASHFIHFILANKNHSPLSQDMFNPVLLQAPPPMHPSILDDDLGGGGKYLVFCLGKYGIPEFRPFGFSSF